MPSAPDSPSTFPRLVGRAVERVEDAALLAGRGRFADDMGERPGTAHAAVLRSPHAHAEIVSLDAAAALSMPEGVTVRTGAEVAAWSRPFIAGVKQPMRHYALAVDRVRYTGEPVAVVVARDRYGAEDALERIEVEYRERGSSMSSTGGRSWIRRHGSRNVCARTYPEGWQPNLGLDADAGLPISTLRGGFADNRDWLEDPSKPAIVVGTIEMIGSRLLFEGYGVSRGMRPYHAGLLGVDALVLLDEAHLCPPFEALLRQVEAHRDGNLGPVGEFGSATPPFRLMSLSATGREEASETVPGAVFRLESDDCEESVVEQRLLARKRLKVTELAAGTNLAESLAGHAIEVGCEAPFSRVLVYCDRRRDAVEVKALIDKECTRWHTSGETCGRASFGAAGR